MSNTIVGLLIFILAAFSLSRAIEYFCWKGERRVRSFFMLMSATGLVFAMLIVELRNIESGFISIGLSFGALFIVAKKFFRSGKPSSWSEPDEENNNFGWGLLMLVVTTVVLAFLFLWFGR